MVVFEVKQIFAAIKKVSSAGRATIPIFFTPASRIFSHRPRFFHCIPIFFTPSPMEEDPRKARRKLIDRKVGRRLECVLKLFACSNLPLFLVGCQSYIGQDNSPLAQRTLDCDQEVINRLAKLFPTDQEHSQSALSRARKKIRNQLLTEEEWEDCWFYIQKKLFGKKMNNNNPVPPFPKMEDHPLSLRDSIVSGIHQLTATLM